ncbi:MAG TPA: polysaccharide biosynthesis tyrosine autokinase [Anaerolineae bacterium]|nr:polysaccharide biosynthesis tyrosine autokinase [Anaerolineae bacterium]
MGEMTIKELSSSYPDLQEISSAELLAKVSVNSPVDSLLIELTVIDADPARAADIANTLGIVFANENERQQLSESDQPIKLLESRLLDLDGELANIGTQIIEIGEPDTVAKQTQFDRLTRELEEARTTYNSTFQLKLDYELNIASKINTFFSIEDAQPIFAPISPRTKTNVILATIIGTLLTLGIILLLDFLDDTVKTPDEAAKVTGASTLASIGFIKGDKPSDRLITQTAPRAPISEAYRVLRTNLSFSAIDTELRSVLVTSSSPGEGKSTCSANTAVVMAQTGHKVILIDADLRKPTQHRIFETNNNHGLTTALLDSSTPVAAHLQATRTPGLRLMASGPLPPNPAELLNSKRMRDVLAELLEDADFVIVDTPPVLTVADAAILAPKVDGCILVAEVGKTKYDILKESSTRLRATNAALFGLVLNRSKAGRAGYYQNYYNERYYSYEYGAGTPKASKKGIFGRLSNPTGN